MTESMFTNEPIDPTGVPTLSTEDFNGVEPGYLRVQQGGWLIVAAIAVIASNVIAAFTPMAFWVATIISIVGISLSALGIVLEARAFTHRGWLLREHDISSRRGLVGRTTTTAPFGRVQHVTVNRGGVDRVVGIAQLSVFTAGAGTADLVIPGLTPETAERLRETVLQRSDAHRVGLAGTGTVTPGTITSGAATIDTATTGVGIDGV